LHRKGLKLTQRQVAPSTEPVTKSFLTPLLQPQLLEVRLVDRRVEVARLDQVHIVLNESPGLFGVIGVEDQQMAEVFGLAGEVAVVPAKDDALVFLEVNV
jgi:hypothetical protein